jgi:hypothetical protein
MAIYYVAHKFGGNYQNLERAKKITHDLQITDLDNTYICPILALSHLNYGELGFEEEMNLCIDILTGADKLIVASELSKGVAREIDFANLVGMEVQYIEDTE